MASRPFIPPSHISSKRSMANNSSSIEMPKMHSVFIIGTASSGKSNLMDMICGLPFSDSLVNVEPIECNAGSYITSKDERINILYIMYNDINAFKMQTIGKPECILAMYDVSKPEDIDGINEYMDIVMERWPNVPMIVSGNKKDLLGPDYVHDASLIRHPPDAIMIGTTIKTKTLTPLQIANKVISIVLKDDSVSLRQVIPPPSRMQDIRLKSRNYYEKARENKQKFVRSDEILPQSPAGSSSSSQ